MRLDPISEDTIALGLIVLLIVSLLCAPGG